MAVVGNLGVSRSKATVFGKDEIAFNEIETILYKYASLIASDAAENLRKPTAKSSKGSTASGSLEASIRITPVTYMGGIYSVDINMLDYFEIVDQGRRPNSERPPISAIKQWIIDKQLRLDDKGLTKNGYKREGTLLSKSKKKVVLGKRKVSVLDAAAYKIASSIGKKGIKPTYFLADAIKNNEEKLYQELGAALKRDVRNLIVVNNPMAEKYNK